MNKVKNFLSRHSTAAKVFASLLIIYIIATASIMLMIDALTYISDTAGNSGYWSVLRFKMQLRELPILGFIPSQLIGIRIAIYIIISAICTGLLLITDKIKTDEKEAQERLDLQNYLKAIEEEKRRMKAKKLSTMRTLRSLSVSPKEKECPKGKKTAWMKDSV